MQTISDIRSLLDERGLRPQRRLGQNFLHDQNQIRRLVAAADLAPGELVLEVGPGTGALSEALLDAGADLVACELDAGLAQLVRERLGDRLTLIEGDCLSSKRTLNPEVTSALAGRPFKLVANLPYQAASPLMSTLLIDHRECLGQWVTIQKEVADRLLAKPGSKAYGPLGIITQALANVERIAVIPPACFWPAPKVTSAMVAISPQPDEALSAHAPSNDPQHDLRDPRGRRAFARFITELFMARRKQLGSTFGRDRPFPAGIDPQQRPEALSIEQIAALWQWHGEA